MSASLLSIGREELAPGGGGAFLRGGALAVGRCGPFEDGARSDVHVRDAVLHVQEHGVEGAHVLHGSRVSPGKRVGQGRTSCQRTPAAVSSTAHQAWSWRSGRKRSMT